MAPLIVRAKTVVTCDTEARQCGIDFDALGRIDDATMLIEDGVITALGPAVALGTPSVTLSTPGVTLSAVEGPPQS